MKKVICTTADISTIHITQEDAKILDREAKSGNSLPILAELEDGYLFFREDVRNIQEDIRALGLSAAFENLYIYFFEEIGVDYLMIRSIGEEIDHLPKFDW